MGGVMRLWNDWEVQILVLVSFMLQVFLLMFAGVRRRNISVVPRTLLWLAYLLADSIAIYILGHMSISSKSSEHQQLMAFWAPFLLMHLGGQDTITAYAVEDNHLWPRHLLSLVVQVLGVAYVLYKYTADSPPLVTAAALIFVAGVLKYGERVWALKSSSLDHINKFLENRWWSEAQREQEPYCPHAQWVEAEGLGYEEVLQGAHDLLPICMGQFMDYKFWPSPFRSKAIKLFADQGCMYGLIEMQLSLMHDVMYTKAMVIHTWCGCFIRGFSLVATITAFFLFHSSNFKNDFSTVDVVITYILVAGALLLEMIAVLWAMGSTWTCALLCSRKWDRLHSIAISVRRCAKAAERNRRWSGSIGQHKLLDLSDGIGRDSRGTIRKIAEFGCQYLWKKLHPSTVISKSTKELVLKEIHRMVAACQGKEEIMVNYSGQCMLTQHEGFFENTTWSSGINFDDKVLGLHIATEIFISSSSVQGSQQHAVVEAIRALSNYMISLLMESPYMLPSPVRSGLYANTKLELGRLSGSYLHEMTERFRVRYTNVYGYPDNFDYELPTAIVRGARLAASLLDKEQDIEEVLQVVLGVWVEMLCYAAHHCGRDSHARQLNNGVEFITIVWLLTTAMFNRFYCDDPWFEERVRIFFLLLRVDARGRLERVRDWFGSS